ncbi:MAG: tRNA uridine-5-carboxymethylaminomethyl(34) synthesis GTPase MnmE [Pseudolabrys sp.]|nr:tRNA uridine-5-carboxymethylaminomethyl(34) synthesis GTPase MnmE [Pseudolabrys sp.]
MPDRPTIFALSSGRPPVAIAVIRISGPRAGAALTALGVKIPEPRKAGLARIRDPRSGEIIDEALVLWFPAPHSETGEDVAELQAHGGRAVIAAILDALAQVEGLRMAEAGEFTRRGFENGKLDLTAVEGLADLVGAETEGQRRQAFRQMKGLLGNRAETWRKRLIQALALVEARIDFSDEADVPEELIAPALTIARELKEEIAAALADGRRGERLREGLVVAIAGPPNAGKSTLLNRIARREAAIVSPHAGTTRDIIEVHLDLGGLPATLLDTAGIRETSDPVEREGVRRARERAAGADLVLWVVDASDRQARGDALVAGQAAAKGLESSVTGAGRVWRVLNKIDLVDHMLKRSESDARSDSGSELELSLNNPLINKVNTGLTSKSERGLRSNELLTDMVNSFITVHVEPKFINIEHEFSVSAVSGEGFELLLTELERYAKEFLTGAEQSLVSRARHREALESTLSALGRAERLAGSEDLLAEELRAAAYDLGRLTGRVDVEDVLDVIFRDFCIGK